MEERGSKDFFRDKSEALSFADLVDIKKWQKIQDNFSAVTGVGVYTVDSHGKFLTEPSEQPRLCVELTKSPLIQKKFCELCLPTFLGGEGIVDKNLSFECVAGLRNFVAPLQVNGQALAYIILGPVNLVILRPKEYYRKAAEELNIDLDALWDMVLEIKILSFHAAQSLVEFFKDVCEYTLKLSYQSKAGEKGMLFDLSKINRVLEILLDVAFQVSGADVGSIMLIDKNKDELTVKTSKGLTEEVARSARIKVGEGISGTAAKEGKSFLIDDNLQDNRIKNYLQRPNISSSMVVPIKVEENIWGVMNLGALRTSSVRFNPDNVQLINSLINLATVTLQ